MIGHAYTVCVDLDQHKTHEVVDLVCGHDVQAARIQMVSTDAGSVEHSLGWVTRTADGADQVAFWRYLGTSTPWVKQGYASAAIQSPSMTLEWYEWIDGGLRLAALEPAQRKARTIVATLFTEGRFAIGEIGEDVDFEVNGEERLLALGSILRLGGDGFSIGSFVHNELPVEAGWGLINEPIDKGIVVSTDWTVHYRPVHVLQGIGNTAMDSWDPQGHYPDLITVYQGAVDLPFDEVDSSQAGSNLGLSTATFADNRLCSVGYATESGTEKPNSRGWVSDGKLIHRMSPRVQSIVGTHKDWVHDGWTVEMDSQIKANWLVGIWYAPTPAKPNVPHETVSGALR